MVATLTLGLLPSCNRVSLNHEAGWMGLAGSMPFSRMMIFGSSDVIGPSQSSSVGSREKIRPELTARNAATAIATSKAIENTEAQMKQHEKSREAGQRRRTRSEN